MQQGDLIRVGDRSVDEYDTHACMLARTHTTTCYGVYECVCVCLSVCLCLCVSVSVCLCDIRRLPPSLPPPSLAKKKNVHAYVCIEVHGYLATRTEGTTYRHTYTHTCTHAHTQACDFIRQCLIKRVEDRPAAAVLLSHRSVSLAICMHIEIYMERAQTRTLGAHTHACV